MKLRNLLFIASALFTFTFTSCSEDDDKSNDINNEQTLDENSYTSNLDSYFPLAIGNKWVIECYEMGNNLVGVDTITIDNVQTVEDTLFYYSKSSYMENSSMNFTADMESARYSIDNSGNVFISEYLPTDENEFSYASSFPFATVDYPLNSSWVGNSGLFTKEQEITGISVKAAGYSNYLDICEGTINTPATSLDGELLAITETTTSVEKYIYYFKKGIGLVCIEHYYYDMITPSDIAILTSYTIK